MNLSDFYALSEDERQKILTEAMLRASLDQRMTIMESKMRRLEYLFCPKCGNACVVPDVHFCHPD